MVPMGFSSRSEQNKQEPGQGKLNEREERALAQWAPNKVPRTAREGTRWLTKPIPQLILGPTSLKIDQWV